MVPHGLASDEEGIAGALFSATVLPVAQEVQPSEIQTAQISAGVTLQSES